MPFGTATVARKEHGSSHPRGPWMTPVQTVECGNRTARDGAVPECRRDVAQRIVEVRGIQPPPIDRQADRGARVRLRGFHLGIALGNNVACWDCRRQLRCLVFAMVRQGQGVIVVAALALATAGHRDGGESTRG